MGMEKMNLYEQIMVWTHLVVFIVIGAGMTAVIAAGLFSVIKEILKKARK
jgi:flagellar motor component MotA